MAQITQRLLKLILFASDGTTFIKNIIYDANGFNYGNYKGGTLFDSNQGFIIVEGDSLYQGPTTNNTTDQINEKGDLQMFDNYFFTKEDLVNGTMSDQSNTVGNTTNFGPSIGFNYSGIYAPVQRWFKNGVEIFNGATGHGSTYSWDLNPTTSPQITIANSQIADSGKYKCLLSVPSIKVSEFTNEVTVTIS